MVEKVSGSLKEDSHYELKYATVSRVHDIVVNGLNNL